MKATLTLFLFVLIGTCSAIFSQTVTIGTQVWMTKNLDVSTFRNGDPIPQAKTKEEWVKAGEDGKPAWCYYDNDPANGAKYGKLYNWYAVNDLRGLAPEGWKIPSDEDWSRLDDFLGDEAGFKMSSKSGWAVNVNGTNESGFSGLPGGLRNRVFFYDIGYIGYWWSSSEKDTNDAWYRDLSVNGGNVYRANYGKAYGFSVRCLRD
jgi:uncharacterized protein (TIGR02145 family)